MIIAATSKSKVINFKLDKYLLQCRFYFPSFMDPLKIILSQFKETYMLLMDFTSILGEDFPDYAKKATWNLLHAYIDAYSQILIDEYTGYENTGHLNTEITMCKHEILLPKKI